MRKFAMLGLMVCGLALFVGTGVVMCEEDAKQDRELVASGHPEWPPVMSREGNDIVGIGPELVKRIFNELGIKVRVPYTGSWEDVLSQAKSGQVDVLVAAYKTKAREEYFAYSDPYTTDPIVVFVPADKTFKFSTSSDLIGKAGIGMTGDSYGEEFDGYIAAHLDVRRVQTSSEAFEMLANHQADYFINSLYAGNVEIKKNELTGIDHLQKFVTEQNFYITISKQSPFVQYLPDVNRLIKKYKEDGTIDQLIAKYQ